MEKKYEYLFFARSYLILAWLGIDEVEKAMLGKSKNPLLEIVPDWVYENNYLLVPVFFNIKHSLEIFLKSTAKFVKESEDFEKHHDIKKLFGSLKKTIGKPSLSIKRELGLLQKLIEKYYGNKFLLKKIGDNFEIKDQSNDVFRYPDNFAKISFDFFYILQEFNKDDLKEIRDDILLIDKLFYDIGSSFLGPKPSITEVLKFAKSIRKTKKR